MTLPVNVDVWLPDGSLGTVIPGETQPGYTLVAAPGGVCAEFADDELQPREPVSITDLERMARQKAWEKWTTANALPPRKLVNEPAAWTIVLDGVHYAPEFNNLKTERVLRSAVGDLWFKADIRQPQPDGFWGPWKPLAIRLGELPS